MTASERLQRLIVARDAFEVAVEHLDRAVGALVKALSCATDPLETRQVAEAIVATVDVQTTTRRLHGEARTAAEHAGARKP